MIDPNSAWNDQDRSLASLWDVPVGDRLGQQVTDYLKKHGADLTPEEDGAFFIGTEIGSVEFYMTPNADYRHDVRTYPRFPFEFHDVWRKEDGSRAHPSDEARHNVIRGFLSARGNRAHWIAGMDQTTRALRFRLLFQMMGRWVEFRYSVAQRVVMDMARQAPTTLTADVGTLVHRELETAVQRALRELSRPVQSLWMDAAYQALVGASTGMVVDRGQDFDVPEDETFVLAVPSENPNVYACSDQWVPVVAVQPVARTGGKRRIAV